MNKERLIELVAYAKVCFEHCTNPFETLHLLKKKVIAGECIDLSHFIAESLDDYVTDTAVEQAEKEFQETQQ